MYALLARVYVHPICYPTLYGFIASGGCHNVIHSFFTPLIPVDNIGRDLSPEPLNGPHARARERERESERERERDRPEGNVFERAGALERQFGASYSDEFHPTSPQTLATNGPPSARVLLLRTSPWRRHGASQTDLRPAT